MPSLISSDLWIGNFISIFTRSNGQFGLSGFGHINQRPAEKPRSRGSYAPALTPRIRSVFVRRTNRLLLSLDEILFWHPRNLVCSESVSRFVIGISWFTRKKLSAVPWKLSRLSDYQMLTLTSRFHVGTLSNNYLHGLDLPGWPLMPSMHAVQ